MLFLTLVLYKIFGKIQELISREASDKKGTFAPLQPTVKGSAGTGKSFITKTIVSYLRRLFDNNDLAHVMAPTVKVSSMSRVVEGSTVLQNLIF
jgi:hypothetical protein